MNQTSRDLRNRTVVITGASAGVGRAVALGFAQAGANLAVIARDRGALDEVNFFGTDSNGNALDGSATLTGLLLGGGIEYAFAPNWSVKLEYGHVGYLSRAVNLATLSTSESVTSNTVKAGINYKFFGPSGVVVARH